MQGAAFPSQAGQAGSRRSRRRVQLTRGALQRPGVQQAAQVLAAPQAQAAQPRGSQAARVEQQELLRELPPLLSAFGLRSGSREQRRFRGIRRGLERLRPVWSCFLHCRSAPAMPGEGKGRQGVV